MPPLPRLLLVALLGLCTAFLVACGDRSKLITPGSASRLKSDVDAVGSAVDAQSCARARDALSRAETDLGRLSSRVDAGLRQRLQEGIQHLTRQAIDECQGTQTQETT